MEHAKHEAHAGKGGHAEANHYGRLLAMLGLSFACMYALMYAMVDRFANVVPNINQFYMAALMTAPMAILELALMGAMYQDKRKNAVIFVLAGLVLVGSWFGIRAQAGVGDAPLERAQVLAVRPPALDRAKPQARGLLEAGQECVFAQQDRNVDTEVQHTVLACRPGYSTAQAARCQGALARASAPTRPNGCCITNN